jgi:phospholipase C
LAAEYGRCGYGERQPLLVISPWAKHNSVDHTLTDQSSIIRFVEDNWRLQRIAHSFDAMAGSLTGMFAFDLAPGVAHGDPPNKRPLILDSRTGQPTRSN